MKKSIVLIVFISLLINSSLVFAREGERFLFSNPVTNTQSIFEGKGLIVRNAKIRKSLGRLLKKFPSTQRIPVIIQYTQFPDEARLKRFRDVKALTRTFKYQPFIAVNLLQSEIFLATNDNLVKMIEPDYQMKILLDNSASLIKSDKVVANNVTGKNIKVAVLDTGVLSTYLGLKGKIIASKDFSTDGTVEDLQGHGTHVSCIVACKNTKYSGIAPDSLILNGKILNKDGSGDSSTLMAGIEWAIDNKANVINMSLGSTISQCDGTDSIAQMVNTAVSKGIMVAVAAGNSGPMGGTINTPGCAESPITVGAVTDYGRMAYFSSRGPTSDGRTKPDLVAPGVEITSAALDGGWTNLSGTSQATPHVAGVLALMLEAKKDLTPADAKKILKETSKDLGYGENIQGKGLMNAEKAISMLFSSQPNETPTDNNNQNNNGSNEQNQTNNPTSPTQVNNGPELSSDEKSTIDNLAGCLEIASLDKEKRDACFEQFIYEQETIEDTKLTSQELTLKNTVASTLSDVDEEMGETESTGLLKKIIGNYLYTENSLIILKEQILVLLNDLEDDSLTEHEVEAMIATIENQAVIEKNISRADKYSRNLLNFSDVDNDVWYLYYVRDLKNKDCISGYKDANGNLTGAFGPANKLTVAEALKISLECTGYPASSATHAPTDPDLKNHWASPYFSIAEDLGLSIINNLENPDREILRSEVVKLLLETFNKKPENWQYKGAFSDVSANFPDVNFIEYAWSLQIVSGDSFKTTFRPNDSINRAEITKVVRQAIEAFK